MGAFAGLWIARYTIEADTQKGYNKTLANQTPRTKLRHKNIGYEHRISFCSVVPQNPSSDRPSLLNLLPCISAQYSTVETEFH